MSADTIPEIPRKISRRGFLKAMGALPVAMAIPPNEVASQHQLTVASLRLNRMETSPENIGFYTLKKLKDLFKQESPDLVIMPEFTFHIGDGNGYSLPLFLDKTPGGYKTQEPTHQTIKHLLANARLLAAQHQSSLFLGTFYELGTQDNKYYNTLLHIDPNGQIVGIKRKLYPPEGNFTIQTRSGIPLRVLPLICGEAWWDIVTDQAGERKIKVPDWVKQGARKTPYDMLTHSLAQGDLDFDRLAQTTQGSEKVEGGKAIEWLKSTFGFYYGEYLPYLKPHAPIIVSDWGREAGVFTGDLQPLKNYIIKPDYTLVKFDARDLV